MELEIEEETIGKVGIAIIGAIILMVVIMFFSILTDPEKSNIVQSVVCGILWWMPGGDPFALYFNCASILI